MTGTLCYCIRKNAHVFPTKKVKIITFYEGMSCFKDEKLAQYFEGTLDPKQLTNSKYSYRNRDGQKNRF